VYYLVDILETSSIINQRTLVHDGVDIPLRLPTQRNERLNFTGTHKGTIDNSVIKRLNTITISGSNEALLVGVPNTDGKFTTKMLKERETVIFVKMEGDFTITLGLKLVTGSLQFGSDTLKVIELTVDNRNNGAILAAQRLLATGQINNRKSGMSEG
jgi:hypothetical protein